MSIHDIPDIYKDDWRKIELFIKNHSFQEKQRNEEQISVISVACQKVGGETEEIIPMFPDIIKEYMVWFVMNMNFGNLKLYQMIVVNSRIWWRC